MSDFRHQIGQARQPFLAVAAAMHAHPSAARWLLAGPLALAASVTTMMAMPLWLPAGAAGVNNIAWPIVLTPLLWAIPFFYACLDPDLPRAAAVLGGLTLLQGALVGAALVAG